MSESDTRTEAAMPRPPAGPWSLQIAREWPTLMLVGLITIALGVLVVAWPDTTLLVLSVIFGIQILVFGVFRLISAFATDAISPGWQGFIGIAAIVIGIIVVRNPFETVAVLAVLLGIIWIISGSVDIIGSIAGGDQEGRWLRLFLGALSLVAGIIVVSWPAPTALVIAWIGGLYLIIFGLFFCVEAWQLRKLTK